MRGSDWGIYKSIIHMLRSLKELAEDEIKDVEVSRQFSDILEGTIDELEMIQ